MTTNTTYADQVAIPIQHDGRFPIRKCRHLLQLYESDNYLLNALAQWLVDGLGESESCVLIGSEDHRRGLEDRLTLAGVDLDEIRAQKRLIFLDASTVVSDFAVDDCVDKSRFSEILGRLIPDALGQPIRLHSELGAVLWAEGKRPAAVRMEELLSELLPNRLSSVFCAHSIESFDSDIDDFGFSRICAAHTDVLPSENYISLDNPAERLKLVSALQHKARLFESEKNALREAASDLAFCHQKLSDFINNSAEGMHRIDSRGEIQFASPAQLRLLGYAQGEYVGHNLAEFHVDRESLEDFWRRLMRHEVLCDFPAALRASDGSAKHVRIHAIGHWESGHFLYARCFMRDVSDCMELERRLRLKNGELAAADRYKDDLLAMLGHELRNPLAAVLNATITAQLNRSYRERALDIARRQIDQLSSLVDELLDAESVKTGRICLERREICIAELMNNCIADNTLLRGFRSTVSISDDARVAYVEGDEVRLRQVVANLIQNAVKFSPAGSEIQITAEIVDREAILKVRDFGCGISQDLLPDIFDLFVQGDRSLDRRNGGLGIGLMLVKRLVEMHGGYVTASSTGLEQGSEFKVHLPLVTVGRTQKRRERPMTSQSARILVVEDNSDAAEALTMLLETFGHQTTVVFDGAAAVEAVRNGNFALALIDIGLPGIDGYEVARQIRTLPNGTEITLVALTGYGQDSDKQAALDAGFDQHLTKPVNIDELRALLDSV